MYPASMMLAVTKWIDHTHKAPGSFRLLTSPAVVAGAGSATQVPLHAPCGRCYSRRLRRKQWRAGFWLRAPTAIRCIFCSRCSSSHPTPRLCPWPSNGSSLSSSTSKWKRCNPRPINVIAEQKPSLVGRFEVKRGRPANPLVPRRRSACSKCRYFPKLRRRAHKDNHIDSGRRHVSSRRRHPARPAGPTRPRRANFPLHRARQAGPSKSEWQRQGLANGYILAYISERSPFR